MVPRKAQLKKEFEKEDIMQIGKQTGISESILFE